jgi:uncharacterized protein DUF885
MDRMALATPPLADADDAELLASRLTGVPAGLQGYAVAPRVGLERAGRALGSWQNGWSPCCGPAPAPTAATLVDWPPRRRRCLGSTPGRHDTCRRPGGPPTVPMTSLPTGWSASICRTQPPILRVGPERYARALQEHLGLTADPAELAAWAWDELDRLEHEMGLEAAAGWSGVPLPEVLDRLDHDPGEPSAAGPAELLDWLGHLDRRSPGG